MCFPTSLLLLEQCHLLTHSSITGRDFTCDAFCPSGYFACFNELISLKRVEIKGGQHQWNLRSHLVLHPMTEGVFINGLVIMCRWQPVWWLASHMLTSTWITISCVCLLFCFPSLTPHHSTTRLFWHLFLRPTSPTPSPCVNLCLPTYCTRDPAAVSDLSVSSLFSFLLLLFTCLESYTHILPSPTLRHQLLSKLLTEPQSVCICGCVWARMFLRVQACMHGHVWL